MPADQPRFVCSVATSWRVGLMRSLAKVMGLEWAATAAAAGAGQPFMSSRQDPVPEADGGLATGLAATLEQCERRR